MEWIYKKSQKKKIRGAGYQGISENLYETEKKCPGKPLACDSGNINMVTAFGGGKGKKEVTVELMFSLKTFDHYSVSHL